MARDQWSNLEKQINEYRGISDSDRAIMHQRLRDLMRAREGEVVDHRDLEHVFHGFHEIDLSVDRQID